MSGDPLAALRMMMLIREIETSLAARREHGFQLLSSGEEAVAVGVCSALGDEDQLLTGGRTIGPALARGVEPGTLVAELLGKRTGTNRGKGGRGHLSDARAGFFGAHAVVGGNISIAAGVALAMQLEGTRGVVAVLFGDGACGAGILHETLNIAALWRLPMLFVCNDNGYSVSTARKDALAPERLADLGETFGIPAQTVDGMNVGAVAEAAARAVAQIREGAGPAFLECRSHRFASHSTTARETRDAAELARIRALCPIESEIGRMHAAGLLSPQTRTLLENDVRAAAAAAFAFADASEYPDPAEAITDVG